MHVGLYPSDINISEGNFGLDLEQAKVGNQPYVWMIWSPIFNYLFLLPLHAFTSKIEKICPKCINIS